MAYQNPWAALFPQQSYQPGIIDSLLYAGLVGLPEAKKRKRDNAARDQAAPELRKAAGAPETLPVEDIPMMNVINQGKVLAEQGRGLNIENTGNEAFQRRLDSGGMTPSQSLTAAQGRNLQYRNQDEENLFNQFGAGSAGLTMQEAMAGGKSNRENDTQRTKILEKQGNMTALTSLLPWTFGQADTQGAILDKIFADMGIQKPMAPENPMAKMLEEERRRRAGGGKGVPTPEEMAQQDVLTRLGLKPEEAQMVKGVFGGQLPATAGESRGALGTALQGQLPQQEELLQAELRKYFPQNMDLSQAIPLPTREQQPRPIPGAGAASLFYGGPNRQPMATEKQQGLNLGQAGETQKQLEARRQQLVQLRELVARFLEESQRAPGGRQ